jgi:hypothetical protein
MFTDAFNSSKWALAATAGLSATGLWSSYEISKWLAKEVILPTSKLVLSVMPQAVKESALFMATESIPYKLYNYDELVMYNIANTIK